MRGTSFVVIPSALSGSAIASIRNAAVAMMADATKAGE